MANSFSLKLSQNVSLKLDKICKELNKPKPYLITKALENYIDEYSDYQLALERLNNQDDKIISPTELRNKLDI